MQTIPRFLHVFRQICWNVKLFYYYSALGNLISAIACMHVVKLSPSAHYGWYLWGSQHMMTSLKGNIFRVTGPLCGEFTGHRWVPLKKASDAELWCFLWYDKRLSTQSRRRWFELPSRSLWRRCNDRGCFAANDTCCHNSVWQQHNIWTNGLW